MVGDKVDGGVMSDARFSGLGNDRDAGGSPSNTKKRKAECKAGGANGEMVFWDILSLRYLWEMHRKTWYR